MRRFLAALALVVASLGSASAHDMFYKCRVEGATDPRDYIDVIFSKGSYPVDFIAIHYIKQAEGIRRDTQYENIVVTYGKDADYGTIYWRGSKKSNPKITMIGSLKMQPDVSIYTETVIGGDTTSKIVANCKYLNSQFAPDAVIGQ